MKKLTFITILLAIVTLTTMAQKKPMLKVDYKMTIELNQGQPLEGEFSYFYGIGQNRTTVNIPCSQFNQIGPTTYQVHIKNVRGMAQGWYIGMDGWVYYPTPNTKAQIEFKVKGAGGAYRITGDCPVRYDGRFTFHALVK